jgi:hypothetical protein
VLELEKIEMRPVLEMLAQPAAVAVAVEVLMVSKQTLL